MRVEPCECGRIMLGDPREELTGRAILIVEASRIRRSADSANGIAHGFWLGAGRGCLVGCVIVSQTVCRVNKSFGEVRTRSVRGAMCDLFQS
jgi:hypothetical protein